jgi:hypothetical protein
MIGMAKLLIGRSAETEGHVLVAFRLSPRDIFTFRWMATIRVSKLHLGEDEEAVTWLQRSVETNHNWPTAHFNLAAALALLRRLDESHSVAKIGLAFEPHFLLSNHTLRFVECVRLPSIIQLTPSAVNACSRVCFWRGYRRDDGSRSRGSVRKTSAPIVRSPGPRSTNSLSWCHSIPSHLGNPQSFGSIIAH